MCDDKRVLAYSAGLVRKLLGEEPLLPVVRTLDLEVPTQREAALAEAGRLVFKPRSGAGGRGVRMPPHDVASLRGVLSADGRGWVAQDRIALSRHQTVVGDGLAPRIVDARLFAVNTTAGWTLLPGGASRYPTREGAGIVNTSQGGGVKDVWVLEP